MGIVGPFFDQSKHDEMVRNAIADNMILTNVHRFVGETRVEDIREEEIQ